MDMALKWFHRPHYLQSLFVTLTIPCSLNSASNSHFRLSLSLSLSLALYTMITRAPTTVIKVAIKAGTI